LFVLVSGLFGSTGGLSGSSATGLLRGFAAATSLLSSALLSATDAEQFLGGINHLRLHSLELGLLALLVSLLKLAFVARKRCCLDSLNQLLL
jgi:hypothetical protein